MARTTHFDSRNRQWYIETGPTYNGDCNRCRSDPPKQERRSDKDRQIEGQIIGGTVMRWDSYRMVKTVEEALDSLEHYQGKAQVIAGGTDLVLQLA